MSDRHKKDVLIIFVRYPEPGAVKTRLAQRIGPERAASLYKLMAESIIDNTRSDDYEQAVFYTPISRKKELREWIDRDMTMYPQAEGDLGARLSAAFAEVFGRGAARAVVIGTDAPLVVREKVSRAFSELKTRDCVIGPCMDGGYYLLGLSGPHYSVFRDISWGGDAVFGETVARIEEAGLRYLVTERSLDIDVWNDVLILAELLKETRPEEAHVYDKLQRELASIKPIS